jgi:hypothetical protein
MLVAALVEVLPHSKLSISCANADQVVEEPVEAYEHNYAIGQFRKQMRVFFDRRGNCTSEFQQSHHSC